MITLTPCLFCSPFQGLPFSLPPGLKRRQELGLTIILVAVVTLWGTGHQGAQEDQKGCGEAETAHLRGLAGGLLRILGADWAFHTHAEGWDQAMRREVGKGEGLGSVLFMLELPT